MSEVQKDLDEYEAKLELELKNIRECQQQKNVDSCMKCALIIGCETRERYVKASYKSMNKGGGGGFDFN